jgi:SAM-dependent methyltransferase
MNCGFLYSFSFFSVTVMDARKMEFVPDQCFDLIIDKGKSLFLLFVWLLTFGWISFSFSVALFDALICSETNLRDIDLLLKEMYRILKTGGVYLIISHAPPEKRIHHFEKSLPSGIEIQTYAIKKPEAGIKEGESNTPPFHFMYVVKKVQA